jgi:hypothetical protein
MIYIATEVGGGSAVVLTSVETREFCKYIWGFGCGLKCATGNWGFARVIDDDAHLSILAERLPTLRKGAEEGCRHSLT